MQGSLEAVTQSLLKLERDDVKVAFVHRAVGGITESDVTIAAASGATIIGFNVRPDRRARELAESHNVEIRTYEIIYKLIEDVQAAMVGMLAPEIEEVVTGDAEVRTVFRVPKVGAVAGCYVTNGVITRGSKVRFLREGVVIWKGAISSSAPFQGRRPRGAGWLRVRHRSHRLPGPQGRRRDRDLRGAGDPPYLGSTIAARASGYPRTARVNAILVQVLGDALERLRDDDDRLRAADGDRRQHRPGSPPCQVFMASSARRSAAGARGAAASSCRRPLLARCG